MIREIIRMKHQGISNSKISESLGKSRTTVIKYVTAVVKSGIELEELLDLSDEDLSELFEPQDILSLSNQKATHSELYAFFPYVEKELKRVGVTRYLLWEEYKQKYPEGIMYSRFCFHYSKWSKKSEGYMPTDYKVGDKLFIDHAGKKLHIIDKQTGEIVPVEVFVGTLGASQYTYVEATYSQKIPDFLESVQNCLQYFGGVPACIIPDNLKSAVTKANKYEPFVNEQFAGFASHYSTSIMPARPLKPKDKSLVEGAVNIAYTRIYAVLRNREFYSLRELNAAIKELLSAYNKVPFQKKEHSRSDLFFEIEKQELAPLPSQRYELREYKMATVQKNCHVYYAPDKNYYSIPHRLIGKKVKMMLTQSIVEIYHGGARVALHQRSRKSYAYITVKDHMPINHIYNSDWSPEYFLQWAERVGTSVRECIELVLQRKQYPEQNYKSCVGILSLASKTNKERLNKACTRALSYNAVGYHQIKNILERGLDKQQTLLDSMEVVSVKHENIRGSNYYQ